MSVRLGYLGPEGSFTHETACELIARCDPPGATLASFESVRAMVRAVGRRDVTAGVVPIATSLHGPIAEHVQAVEAGAVSIEQTIERICRYALLAVDGASIEEVTMIRSHPEALADCANHLRRLAPYAVQMRAASSGAAARQVAAESGRWQAAVAPASAAALYGLTILATNLEDDPNNRTTWAIIAPRA